MGIVFLSRCCLYLKVSLSHFIRINLNYILRDPEIQRGIRFMTSDAPLAQRVHLRPNVQTNTL